eukprot:scaffold2856_cov121-Skeletonema_menzelii.AAC.3
MFVVYGYGDKLQQKWTIIHRTMFMVFQMMLMLSLLSMFYKSSCNVAAFSFSSNSMIHQHLNNFQQRCSLSVNPIQATPLMMTSVAGDEGLNNTTSSDVHAQEQSDDDDEFNSSNGTKENSNVEEQLQKRFEEAMQRRIKRSKHKDVEPVSDASKIVEPSSDAAKAETVVEDIPELELQDTTIQTNKQKANSPPKIRIEDRYKSVEQESFKQKRKTSSRQPTRDYPSNDYRDDYESFRRNPRTEDYDDYNESSDYENLVDNRSKQTCEWETYRATSILFPPLPSGRPKAILHFVGGTFFGSYPKKFYGSLLEDIATKCEAVVVATPIPVILPGKSLVNRLEQWMFDEGGSRGERRKEGETNPLDHVYLAEYVQREFNNAYRDIILDEFFGDFVHDPEVETFMKDTPIVGIGHSLGARIQAVSCSHPQVSNRYLSMGKGKRLIRSGRDGMIYLGFANWGASSSIPGLEQLERTVKKKENTKQEESQSRGSRRGDGVGRQDDVWAERSTRRRNRSRYDESVNRRYGRYDRYDVEDLDITDIFSDVVTGVAKGVNQISEALTPDANSLEFNPTPDELWEDLSPTTHDIYRKACRNNLIIQFDQDRIDQGSRLTRTLMADATDQPRPDIKFARLHGGHLTPVTLQDGISKFLPKGAMALFSSSYDFILQQFDDERTGKSSLKQRQEARDVANTVASYIESLTKSEKT